MTTTIGSPTELFPGPPTVSLDVPDDWVATPAPDAVLAARRPGEAGEFMSNVVVRVDHREDGFVVDRAVEEIRRNAASRPSGESAGVFRGEIDGVPFDGVDISWVDERAGTILQVHLFSAVPPVVEGGATYLVQMIGSVGAARAEVDYPTIKQIMLSARIDPWSGPSSVGA